MQDFNVTASTIGLLTSIQFFVYTSLQIPMGILADRFGPNFFLIIGATLTGLGTIIYSLGTHEFVLFFARILTGVGDAAIWVNMVGRGPVITDETLERSGSSDGPREALLCTKAKRQQQMFSVAKAKRQLQMFSVAKAKRQLQSAQPERKSTLVFCRRTKKRVVSEQEPTLFLVLKKMIKVI